MKIALVHNQTPETLSVAAKFKDVPLWKNWNYHGPSGSCGIDRGDGTLLSAFHKYEEQLNHVRFVGIHTGHLGFLRLAYLNELPERMESLKHDDKGESVSYPLLDIARQVCWWGGRNPLHRSGQSKFEENGRNDGLRYLREGWLFETFRGDGLCFPPTGSTGFSKSLGGPLSILEAIQLTEMASVNNRIYRTLRFTPWSRKTDGYYLSPRKTLDFVWWIIWHSRNEASNDWFTGLLRSACILRVTVTRISGIGWRMRSSAWRKTMERTDKGAVNMSTKVAAEGVFGRNSTSKRWRGSTRITRWLPMTRKQKRSV